MGTAALLVVAIFAVYTACRSPTWFWTVFVGGTAVVEIMARLLHFDPFAIPGGVLLLRSTDGGLFGLVVGVIYHARRRDWRELIGHPLGGTLTALFCFFLLKVCCSATVFSDQILANPEVSHALGGLAATLGDLREAMLPLLTIFFAYVVRASCDVRRLGWPITVAVLLLITKGFVIVGLNGHIFTGTADTDDRFITSGDAITLTIFGLMLLFLRARRLTAAGACSLGCFSIAFATVANHRSQWLGLLSALAVLIAFLLLGRPFIRQVRLARVGLAGAALAAALGTNVLMNSTSLQQTPLVSSLTVRLLAITHPSRDPTSAWREQIWRDRVAQVGSDWPWGRPFGDRRGSLYHGIWITLPDHSAYVTLFELGGVILCGIMLLFALRIVQLAFRHLMQEVEPERLWPSTLSLSLLALSLAFGSAYLFPYVGLPMVLVLLNWTESMGVPVAPATAKADRAIEWRVATQAPQLTRG